MTRTADPRQRGWCPGALRPMESGDGLIVRVRPRAGRFPVDTLIALAHAASRYGNGHIDLTRRANLQLRGVADESLPQLVEILAEHGLLDANAEAEAVRNILVSPLAGADPSEVLDARVLAVELERLLETDRTLWSLPGKFGFLIDGGGVLPLDAERADIRLRAIRGGEDAHIAVGIDRPGGPLWLGLVHPAAAPATAVRVAHAFLETRPACGHARLRDLTDSNAERIRAAVSGIVEPIETPPLRRARSTLTGLLKDGAHVFAAGIAVPFGRLESGTLLALCEVFAIAGVDEVRPSPWRTLYVALGRGTSASRVVKAAAALGLITKGEDLLLKVSACPGAPACRSATTDARGDARLIAAALATVSGIHSVHVSGCPKGCARSEPADLVLVAHGDGYGIVRNGTASDRPDRFIGSAELDRLPSLLANPRSAPRHG
jgi:precorrin-3B synthase